MVQCLECAGRYIPKERLGHHEMAICPECLEAYKKREEIRNAISILEKYSKIGEENPHSKEFHRINGFSWAQKEQFTVTITRFIKSFQLLEKETDFVHANNESEYKKQKSRSGW